MVPTTHRGWVAALIALAAFGCNASGPGPNDGDRGGVTAQEVPTPIAPTLVRVEFPRRGVIRESLTLSGDLQAIDTIDLTSRTTEVVVEVLVRESQPVARGQRLVQLDDRERRLAVREAEQSLEEAVARLGTGRLDLVEAEHNASLQQLAVQRAEQEAQRIEQVLAETDRPPLSQEVIEQKRFARDEARLSHAVAVLAIERAGASRALLALAVEQARARLDRALLELERTTIVSPIEGTVAFLEARPGELVQAGVLVASVVSSAALHADVRIPQRHLFQLRAGQPVRLQSETCPGTEFDGRVAAIHPTIDPQQGTVKVRVEISDTRGQLLPGAYVTARLDLAVHEQALLVPKRARLFEGGESVLYVVREGQAVRVPIRVGLQDVEELEVLPDAEHPIGDADRVVVSGQAQLKPGAPVVIEARDAPGPEAGAEDPLPGPVGGTAGAPAPARPVGGA